MATKHTFASALVASERIEGRIMGGPTVVVSKVEMRRHYKRGKVPFEWHLDNLGTLYIGDLAREFLTVLADKKKA